MEFKMQVFSVPETPIFNYEELKQELVQRTSVYGTMVYTDEEIKNAKADRANLNRLKKALNDERIRREREYMEPFATFKAQIAEIVGIIDKAAANCDRQIKEYEEQQKEKKLNAIREYFNEHPSVEGFETLQLEQIMDAKWLNASVSMKSIQETIDARLEQIEKDLAVVRSLPSYAFEAEEAYFDTLDLAKAVSEAHRLQAMAEKKAAYEAELAKKAEEKITATATVVAKTPDGEEHRIAEVQVETPARQWVKFQALLSVEEAKVLGEWFRENGIRYKAV